MEIDTGSALTSVFVRQPSLSSGRGRIPPGWSIHPSVEDLQWGRTGGGGEGCSEG